MDTKPFALTQDDIDELEELLDEHRDKQNDFDSAENELQKAVGRYNDALSEVKESAEEIRDWLDERLTVFEERYDERPDSWQQSPRGRAVKRWIATLESLRDDAQQVCDDTENLSEFSEPEVTSVSISSGTIKQEPEPTAEAA